MGPSQDSTKQEAVDCASDDQSTVTALTTIVIHKGGGTIRGIGEKLVVNPIASISSMSVPIVTSASCSGFGPRLSFSYDSGTDNGLFDFAWNISLSSITRKTDKGLRQYQDNHSNGQNSDVIIPCDAEYLVPVYQKNTTDEWIRDTQVNLVIHKDEIDGFYVRYYRFRIEGLIEDLFACTVRWIRIAYVSDVHWRSILSKDNIFHPTAKILIYVSLILHVQRIFSFLMEKVMSAWYEELTSPTLTHDQDPGNVRNLIYTFLKPTTQNGYKSDGDDCLKLSLPSVEFEYTEPIAQDRVAEVDPASLENLPIDVGGASYQWMDFTVKKLLAEQTMRLAEVW